MSQLLMDGGEGEKTMRMNRRDFMFKAPLAGAGLAIAAKGISGITDAPRAVLKLSSQEGVIPGQNLREKARRMDKWGFDGLEVWGGGLPKRIEEVKDAIKGTRLRISAICAGYKGVLISDDKSVREQAVKSIKEILPAAGDLEATGLIMVPAFNGQTKLDHVEGRKILVDLLPELGEAARKAGTRVLLEPLNRGEAWFLRQLADAAAICRDVNHPAVCMMGDFYHMGIEETSDLGAFISGGKYVHHVHLASRKRNLPGQDKRSFRGGFQGLKWIGYQDYCSFECGVIGAREVEIPKSLAFLRKEWEKAVL